MEARVALFGPFVFHLETRELRKYGTRVRIEEIPARVLVRLLEAPGTLVSRDELIALLWPGESHGDFSHRLNKAVNKLRLVLGESATDPRYIRTFSRRGYSFIAEVKLSEPEPNKSPAAATAETIAVPVLPVTPVGVRSGFRWWLIAAAVLALFGTVLEAFRVPRESWLHAQSKKIAVLPFSSDAKDEADQWLSLAIADWLITDVSSERRLRPIPLEAAIPVETEFAPAKDGSLTPVLTRKLSRVLGADFVVCGHYAVSAEGADQFLHVDLVLQQADGSVVRRIQIEGPRAQAMQLVSQAGLELRAELGLPAITPQRATLLHAALPRSPEASRLYVEGVVALQNFDPMKASALLSQAAAIEPEHVGTHTSLALAWSKLGYDERARHEADLAYRGAESFPQEQRWLLDGVRREMNKDWAGAANDYSALHDSYPDDVDYALKLAASQTAGGNGVLALATIQGQRAGRIANQDPRLDLAEASAAASISDYARQIRAATSGEAKAREQGAKFLVAEAQMQIGSGQRAMGNIPEALQLWHLARETFDSIGDRHGVAESLNQEGALLWQQGEAAHAKQAFRQAIEISRANTDNTSLASALANLGRVDIYTRDLDEARQLFEQALVLYRQTENVAEQAYVLSLIADEDLWFDHLADAKKRYQEALALSRSVNDRSRIAGRLMDIGIIDTVQGNLGDAANALNEALAIYGELGEKNRAALVQNRLAIVLMWRGELAQAASTIQKSIDVSSSLGEANVLAEMLENQAYIQLLQNPELAGNSAQRALQRHLANGDIHGVAQDETILAETIFAQGKPEEARAHLQKAFAILGENPPHEIGLEMLILRARLAAQTGDFLAAKRDLRRSMHVASSIGAGSMELQAQFASVEMQLQAGNNQSHAQFEHLAREARERQFGFVVTELQSLAKRFPEVEGAIVPQTAIVERSTAMAVDGSARN